jgi:hypothetical protein
LQSHLLFVTSRVISGFQIFARVPRRPGGCVHHCLGYQD